MNSSRNINRIKAIILDVDGVLTDGRIAYIGDQTVKFFNSKDGLAMRMALDAGYLVGLMTGRKDAVNIKRAEELNLSFCYTGASDKNTAFDRLLKEFDLQAEECLYIGDDLIDIPVLVRSGIGVCVADAADEILCYADWQTSLPGGRGAVRETIIRLLKAQGRWESAVARFLV